jgi:hypothetical protein
VHSDGQGSMHIRVATYPSDEARMVEGALIENMGLAGGAANALAKQAEGRWRNGACVEVSNIPTSKELPYSGKTTFRSEVRHKRNGSDGFPYPVQVMAPKSAWIDQGVEHSGSRIFGTFSPPGPATTPATFNYTAPAQGTQPGQLWSSSQDRLFPMSISRRGIGGAPFTARFASGPAWRIERDVRIEIAGKGVFFTSHHEAVIRPLEQPLADGTTHAGTGTFNAHVVAGIRHCLNEKSGLPAASVTRKMKATATVEQVGEDSVNLAFFIGPAKEYETLEDAAFAMDQLAMGTYAFRGRERTEVDTVLPSSPCGETVRQIIADHFRRVN